MFSQIFLEKTSKYFFFSVSQIIPFFCQTNRIEKCFVWSLGLFLMMEVVELEVGVVLLKIVILKGLGSFLTHSFIKNNDHFDNSN